MASLKLASGSAAALVEGAILGDTPSPYCALKLFTGATLSTGVLAVGDTGEFGGLNSASVEFWFRISALPAALRSLIVGPEISVGNRQWGFELNTNGTVRFYARNNVGTLFLITSNTALLPGSGSGIYWYHIAGVFDNSTTLRLYLNGAQEVTTAISGSIGATAGNANGDMRVGSAGAAEDFSFDEIASYRSALGSARVSAHYIGGSARGFRSQFTDASGTQTSFFQPIQRITAVLDASQSVHASRSIMAGSRTVVEAYQSGQSPLDELSRARSAENVDAMLFVSKSGAVTFLDASHRSVSPWNTVQMIFGDAGGTEVSYLDFSFEYSETFIVNEWNVTRSVGRRPDPNNGDGSTQTASDATSIQNYYKRSQSMTDVPVIQDLDASAIATAMLAKYKDPMYRGFTLTVSTGDPNVALNCLQRELGDRVEVKRSPPGGGARIDQILFIQKIEVSGDNSSPIWTIKFGLSPL